MKSKDVDQAMFYVEARKAVNRLGRWILLALYRHPPVVLVGYVTVKLDEMREGLPGADEDHRRWLRARITAWSWVLRWVSSLEGARWAEVRVLANHADERIRESSSAKVPDRARVETFVGWKRLNAERVLEERAKRKKRKKRSAA